MIANGCGNISQDDLCPEYEGQHYEPVMSAVTDSELPATVSTGIRQSPTYLKTPIVFSIPRRQYPVYRRHRHKDEYMNGCDYGSALVFTEDLARVVRICHPRWRRSWYCHALIS